LRERWPLWIALLFIAAGGLLILLAWPDAEAVPDPAVPAPTRTPEPIVPTPTPVPGVADATPPPATTPVPVSPGPSPSPAATPAERTVAELLYAGKNRWGIGVASRPITHYDVEPLRLGWYVNWRVEPDPARPGGAEFAQMVRLKGGALQPDGETIADVARATPGSLWLIGNEPDVKWQDNVDPITYARLYHEAYAAIRGADPTARVAIGGVAQPTPIRLRYLDAILEAYQDQFGADMPVDVWNVHNFVLREERGAWGVDIPPGFDDQHGALYEIEDSASLEHFRQQIWDFRRWMARRGFQNRPLIVSEYGVLMPEDYGFPPERVTAFLVGTFDFFLTASDPALGYPEDGYRLVQRWCWYSLDAPDTYYPTGRLFDPQTGAMTAVGQGWATYVAGGTP